MKRSEKRGDASQVAWSVVQEATGQSKPAHIKDPAAVERGRKGGLARAARLAPDERTQIARDARNRRTELESARDSFHSGKDRLTADTLAWLNTPNENARTISYEKASALRIKE